MTQWKLRGTYFETCNCEGICPCVVTSPPTEGECTVLIAWHIGQGNYGEVPLDGLNAALAVHSPGNMVKTKWTVAAYLDKQADGEQTDALHAIFSGKAGGHPALLASFIGKVLGTKSVPMHFHSEGRQSSLSIPGIAQAEIEELRGQGDGPVTLAGHTLCIAPLQAATLAKSTQLRFTDHGWEWLLSGRAGYVSPFAYASA